MSILQTVYEILVFEVQHNPLRLVIDVLVFLISIYVILQNSYKLQKKPDRLSDEEVKEVVDNFNPDPLVPSDPSELDSEDDESVSPRAIVKSLATPMVRVEGVDAPVLNLATYNFLNMTEDEQILEKCKQTILKYGVGSCGPRGFYGSIDVHIELEQKLQKFYNCGGAILYSFGFCTISSIIPVFSKQDDIIVADSGCNFAIQVGMELSRSRISWFKHNDLGDLEEQLKKITAKDKKGVTPKNRRFIIVEGVYENYGDLAPLDKINELAKKYCFRIIMEDSFGIGVLGKTGRGTHEHFNIPIEDIEILVASLEASLGSGGAFCVGSRLITEHQRLASIGYVFSASSPPYFSTAGIEALNKIDAQPELMERLATNISLMHQELKNSFPVGGSAVIIGDGKVPIFHIGLANPPGDRKEHVALINKIAEESLQSGVAVVCPRHNSKEYARPPPTLRLTVSANHSSEQIKEGVRLVAAAIQKMKM